MKYFLNLIFVLVLCFSFQILNVNAHSSETDKAIEATIHIDPSESPLAGSASNIKLMFTDEDRHLDILHCDCKITISKDNQTAFSKFSTDTGIVLSSNSLSIEYVFPIAGNYKINVEGKPQAGYSFDDFSFNFEKQVNESGENSDKMNTDDHAHRSFLGIHLIHILLFGGAIIIAIWIIIFDKRDRTKN